MTDESAKEQRQIEESNEQHRLHDPHYFGDDDSDWLMECDACSGDGWIRTRPTDGDGTISMECPDCGGVGWE